MAYQFFHDDNGDPRAATSRDRRRLGRFLETDMQGSVARCAEVLDLLDDIAVGRRKRWQMTGNAYTLILSKRRARIHAEFGRAADLILPTSELRQVLLECQTFLERSPRRSR